jgi:cytochrome c553
MSMPNCALLAAVALTAVLIGAGSAIGGDAPPPWAYPFGPYGAKTPDDGVPRHVPDSEAVFTLSQTGNPFFSPDWHPEDHPPLPVVVIEGRKPGVLACGYCHRADGSGGPENAKIAGLPAAYIAQQIADYRTDARKTSAPERLPPKYMIITAKSLTDQESAIASAYFAAIRPKVTIRVVETDAAPLTKVEGDHLELAATPGTEPIGQRIIEVPETPENFHLRDGRTGFVAYVPPGSIERGRALVAGDVAKSASCGICHGTDLKGLGPIPGIAGRSPSYLVRQLYDFQTGARAGEWSGLMLPIVQKLSLDDMIALAAYAASLRP